MAMNEPMGKPYADLMDRAKALCKTEPDFGQFFVYTVGASDPHDLTPYKPDAYEALLRRSFAQLGQRSKGKPLVRIWTPATGPKVQVVDVFVDDMPFIVDSVLGAIRAMGATIRLFSHPVLPVDPDQTPWAVHAKFGQNDQRESFLQVHIDPIEDEVVLAGLYAEIEAVLIDVRRTVRGWRPMLERLRELVHAYHEHPPAVPGPVLAEALNFLAWLADHNFTFLGMREYRLTGTGKTAQLEPVKDSGLGVLEDPEFYFLRHGENYVEMTQAHVAFLRTSDPLMVTKANVRARVHRRGHMDYVGAKLYDEAGTLVGELRIVGLFTSMSLTTPHTDVPLIRRKISEVMRRSGNEPKSHAGKSLMTALDAYPRDELFQISEVKLVEFGTIIAALADRPRVRVLPRVDRFDNFVSILLFMPRDLYTSKVRADIGAYLAGRYDGRVSGYHPSFPEGEIVRVHYIIGRNGGKTPRPPRAELERDVIDLTRSFGDRFVAAARDPSAVSAYTNAFCAAYQAAYTHRDALADIAVFNGLGDGDNIAVRLAMRVGDDDTLSLKVFHRDAPIPLSERVPMLENFGFKVIDERSFEIVPADGIERFLHDMVIEPADGGVLTATALAPLLESALLAVWSGATESDGFNQLTDRADLAWDDVSIIRALARYLKQVGLAYSQKYLWTTLGAHPDVAGALVALFHTLHDPGFAGERERDADTQRARIAEALEATASLDEDRIIRRFLNLVEASVRTNFYQRDARGRRRPAMAIKFDTSKVEGLPDPRPFREVFVYSPRVEGVHMRGGAIARGGLRWSDRPQDFRTEVLGLVKAQMVKNAVIVPMGAKGGFVPHKIPAGAGRETAFAEGTACYKIFVGALLDVTDNLDANAIVTPKNVVCRDGDDPYLVVAADKGTATFSDTANAIAIERGFWLGDAFASGGSAGYDHKKMGITARGGWEAVKRHFLEMDRDIQSEPFSVAGVGDMSGDVFGNGMLLSGHTRLVAAFDHRDIFIDPDPDAGKSLAERKRLFGLGRSSWRDYDENLISRGGGVFSRSAKSIAITPEIQKLLDIGGPKAAPNEVMTAILGASVDLLWFGGIGTYVRAFDETDTDVGDRANDAIRISGRQVRAKVIGEGANLGITQRGRVEYAQRGGHINTDAIDNSAGVNSSDLEVNIKIALGTLVRAGKMTGEARNALLAEMTDEVAGLCLRNNYLQTLAISLSERRGAADFPDHVSFMQALEHGGHLNRAVEFLPDDAVLAERAVAGQSLTRPELAVILAYAKNTLYAELLACDVPDDPYLSKELFRYFPGTLTSRYPDAVETHRLRREVIATVLANAMINRGGPAYVHRMSAATSANAARIAFAHAAARDSYGLTDLNGLIDTLDGKIRGETQLALYEEARILQINQTLWFLRNEGSAEGLSALVERYKSGIGEVREMLPDALPHFVAKSVSDQAAGFENGGAPEDLARRIAELSALTLASDIVLVATRCKAAVRDAAKAYFAILERFNLGRITELGGLIALSDRYDRMALDRALANLMRAQRDLSADVLECCEGPVPARLAAWHDAQAGAIDRIVRMVTDLTEGDLTVSRLSVAAGLLSDLATA